MFLYFLFHLSHSTVIEFNKNYDLQNKSFSPLVIYCYKNDLKKGTKETIKQINLCSKIIPDIYFFLVNCSNTDNNNTCYQYCSSGNSFLMIQPSYHIFEGEPIAFDLVNFFESNTDKKRIDIKTSYEELHPNTFDKYIDSKSSSLIAFLEISDKVSDLMIPQLQQIAFIYSSKPKFGVAFIDCKRNIEFCLSRNVEYVPSLRAYHDNEYTDYLGPRNFVDLLNFSNNILKEFRSPDGSLNKLAGVIPSLYPIVQRFMKENDKFDMIEEAKKVEGSEYYIALMKRIIRNGEGALESEERKIRNALNKTQEKLATRDILRSSLNVLKVFKKAGPYTPLIHTDREL
ncbi:hypothetical protein M9Y10_034861 [Tritrichomonas musculus]|uniref:protein disulfide-isomerase n=1 Tax=Tritrichomonas musculus TaxID=1915356 RepID=A0ABR2KGZ0_9EUKA